MDRSVRFLNRWNQVNHSSEFRAVELIESHVNVTEMLL